MIGKFVFTPQFADDYLAHRKGQTVEVLGKLESGLSVGTTELYRIKFDDGYEDAAPLSDIVEVEK